MRTRRCRGTSMTFDPECRRSKAAKLFSILSIIVIGLVGAVIYGYVSSILSDMKENAQTVRGLEEKIDELLNDIREMQKLPKCPKNDQRVVQKAIKEHLDKYDADKTGRPDYALESAGGKIISIRSTENYPSEVVKLLGVTLCTTTNEPKLMISPGSNPGECWAFKGTTGSAIIELIGFIYINGVTLEHIPRTVSPTGDIKTAPKDFSILGLACIGETEGELLGNFTYNDQGPSLQYFPIEKCAKPYKLLEFRVHSNHGNNEFTCVYRLRVHGDLDSGSTIR